MPYIEIIIHPAVEEKIEVKHNVRVDEVWEVFHNPDFKAIIYKSPRKGEKRYLALGRTFAGRYLTVAFVRPKKNAVRIITARDMERNERRQYNRKRR